ncbi:LysE family translocator [Vibrio nigripulchritudo]|uniref:LysE family translocator n=1 Tax=Vibrio nigripulchritudo TaxID=28173 RepID=UPI0003B23CEA|nr:LysE family translocator [Vibrio nigripulchritudo]CCN71980.1 Putative threonine/lysine efflux protein family [Vibrio nigripulchritudo SFn118]
MSLDTWMMFFLAYLVVTLSPGPNVLLVVKNSVQYGIWSAFTTVLGNLFCQLLIVGLVAIGVGEFLTRLPAWFFVMKCVGGLYLIYLGIRSFKQVKKDSLTLANLDFERPKSNSKSLFREAFFVSVSNPKTMIFLSAFLPQFLDTSHSHATQFVIMYLSIFVIVSGVHLSYALAICRIGKKLNAKKFEGRLAKVSGSLFIGMGGGVLLSSKP